MANAKKASFTTILEIYLQGTSGAYCVIQQKAEKYRVSVGQNAWKYFDNLELAAECATKYQAQYNAEETVQYTDAKKELQERGIL